MAPHPASRPDPELWLARAEEVRALADRMDSPENRLILLEIAELYLRMAERLARRNPPSSAN